MTEPKLEERMSWLRPYSGIYPQPSSFETTDQNFLDNPDDAAFGPDPSGQDGSTLNTQLSAAQTAPTQTASVNQQTTISFKSYSGIYVQSNALRTTNQNLPDSVYSAPQVNGVSLALVWATIEPSPGVFDWTTLDAEVNRAVASGKKISISVDANRDTISSSAFSAPPWLFSEGVPDLQFTAQMQNGQTYTVDLAPPWNATYQQAYAGMMQALSSHLQSIRGAYQDVSIVKVTGIDQITEETRLPATTSSTSIWQSAGYTPTLVINAWNTLAASVNAAFPNKVLGIDILDGNAFPPINDQGQQVTTTDPSYVDVTQQIINAGLASYGGRFEVQWDGLNSTFLSHVVLAAEQQGAIGGWQTNHWLSSGAGFGSSFSTAVAPTQSQYQQILDFGIRQGAGQYIEIWPADLQQFPQAVGEAKTRIAGDRVVANGATLEIKTATSAGAIFSGAQGTLQLDRSLAFTGYISAFRGQDRIDLRDVAFSAQTTLGYTTTSFNADNSDPTGGTLSVSDGTHTANLALLGNYTVSSFVLSSDGNGGTLVTDPPAIQQTTLTQPST
jgi:hypothetical protein